MQKKLLKSINSKIKSQKISLFHLNLKLMRKVLSKINKNHIQRKKVYLKNKLMTKATITFKHYWKKSDCQSKKDKENKNKNNKCNKV